jgi:transcriptional regulator with XRE-family HTH domain
MIRSVTYGERFAQLRLRLGLTPAQLAHRLFGDAERRANVSAIEQTAGRIPTPKIVRKHAEVLSCDVSELVVPVDDTWLDRARRGEFDTSPREAHMRGSPLEPRTARRRRANSS